MTRPLPIAGISVHSLAIPMRGSFRHAAAERAGSEPVIVALELADRTVGYGETHPRPYVTGESAEDVHRSIEEIFVPLLVEMRPANFGEAIECAADLPTVGEDGAPITAARAAVELALLDAYSLSFQRSLASVAGWFGENWLGEPGSTDGARYSVVISSMAPKRVRSFVRKVRLARIRHFKLKVGDEEDDARLQATVRALGRGLEEGKITLVLDANGAWDLEQAIVKLQAWQSLPITCVEQPLPRMATTEWHQLQQATTLPLMPDESLVTGGDAQRFAETESAQWFNIRISKNGGLLPAIRLAILARRHGLSYQLGCMVGETSILSAAGRWFMQTVPGIRFAEGSFGRFLLRDDVVKRSLRFTFGGKWRPLHSYGLGVRVEPERLQRLAASDPVVLPF